MQMTKPEIAETQIIVTTPEKWDVVTRKPSGEGEIVAVNFSKFPTFTQSSFVIPGGPEAQIAHH
jgi:hypothetical protein